MSTSQPPHPAYQQNPGPYQAAPGPYQAAPGPYQQAPGPYQQSPGPYAQAPAGSPQAPTGHPQPSGPYAQAPAGYAQAPYPQAPGGYGQAGYQQAPGAYPAAPGAGCEVCGASPAAPVTVRGHQGMVVIMRQLRRQGTFCHTCALAVFRKMQSDTMAQGWWGPMSMIITPITLLINLFALAKIRKLPAPVAPQGPGLDPGRPVLARPMGMVGLVPLTGFTLFLLLVFIGMAAG
ncbi:LppU/SCO3897 family protein [Streptomyces sp. NPDC001709]